MSREKMTTNQQVIVSKSLKQAIEYSGGNTRLAQLIGTSKQNINNWLNGYKMPFEKAILIQIATGYKTNAYELRPDIPQHTVFLEPIKNQLPDSAEEFAIKKAMTLLNVARSIKKEAQTDNAVKE